MKNIFKNNMNVLPAVFRNRISIVLSTKAQRHTSNNTNTLHGDANNNSIYF